MSDPVEVDDPAFWRALADSRGQVIRALHEFNYWHESTVARGEVIAGLERSAAQWRERALAAEAQLQQRSARAPGALAGRLARRVRDAARRRGRAG
jgi:hypothetical protein